MNLDSGDSKVESKNLIKVSKDKVQYLDKVDIFFQAGMGFVKWGKTDKTKTQLANNKTNRTLYIRRTEKEAMFEELKANWSKSLKDNVEKGDAVAVKTQLTDIAEGTIFEDPRDITPEALEVCKETVQQIISDMNLEMLQTLINMSGKSYGTVAHSVNCMMIGMALSHYIGWHKDETYKFSMCCLVHDIGKIEIDNEILHAPRKLTDTEFEIMKSHTKIGASILSDYDFGSESLNHSVMDCARYHHEKMDGSGYWHLDGEQISKYNRILGIIDCYEALTSDTRSYREAMSPYDSLKVIKGDVINGKYERSCFEKFVTNFVI